MIRVNIHLALSSLKAAKIRSLLTMVAVIIGVSSFLIVTSTVDGLRDATVEEINDLGGNLVQVVSGDVIVEDDEGNESFNFLASAGASTLTPEDLETVVNTEGVEAAAPIENIVGTISRGEEPYIGGFIVATTSQYPQAFQHNVKDGVFLSDESTGNFAVVGTSIVENLYGGDLALGSRINLRGESFTIVGVMEEQTSTIGELFGFDLNNAVYISVNSAEEITGGPIRFTEIDAQLRNDVNPEEVIARMEAAILENHNGEVDFSVLKQDQLVGLVDSLLGTIKLAGQFLSSIMLFVASIVILLIMLITVRERTREIGIRKSIGATNGNILVQFLTEAVIISWVGSLIGLGIGVLLGFALRQFADITPVYSINTFLVVFVISTAVGAMAGVIPAWQAARKDPVDSLRHE